MRERFREIYEEMRQNWGVWERLTNCNRRTLTRVFRDGNKSLPGSAKRIEIALGLPAGTVPRRDQRLEPAKKPSKAQYTVTVSMSEHIDLRDVEIDWLGELKRENEMKHDIRTGR